MNKNDQKISSINNILTTRYMIIMLVAALVVSFFAYHFILNKTRIDLIENAKNENNLVINLSKGFVKAYSDFESQYANGLLPSRAIYRSHALELANLNSLFEGALHSEVVGFPGKSINKGPTDDKMRRQMLLLQTSSDQDMNLTSVIKNDKSVVRTVAPFYATEQACVDCHNSIQHLTEPEKWQVGDLMGAQVVEKSIKAQLIKSQRETFMISLLIFCSAITVSLFLIIVFQKMLSVKESNKQKNADTIPGCINRS